MVTLTPFITIDVKLSSSRYRLVTWFALVLGLALMLSLLALPMSYRIGLVVLLISCTILSQLLSKQLLALTALTSPSGRPANISSLQDIEWQLQWVQGYIRTPWGSVSDMYAATLNHIHHYGHVMVLEFDINTPLSGDTQSLHQQFIIWQDQLDVDSWRKLSVLANQ